MTDHIAMKFFPLHIDDPERVLREALRGKWFTMPKAAEDRTNPHQRRPYRDWADDEIAMLVADYKAGNGIAKLASDHGRSQASVESKIRQLVAEGRIKRRASKRFGR